MVAGSPKFEVERASEPEASSPTVLFLFCFVYLISPLAVVVGWWLWYGRPTQERVVTAAWKPFHLLANLFTLYNNLTREMNCLCFTEEIKAPRSEEGAQRHPARMWQS